MPSPALTKRNITASVRMRMPTHTRGVHQYVNHGRLIRFLLLLKYIPTSRAVLKPNSQIGNSRKRASGVSSDWVHGSIARISGYGQKNTTGGNGTVNKIRNGITFNATIGSLIVARTLVSIRAPIANKFRS
jgi:hypothetical protein